MKPADIAALRADLGATRALLAQYGEHNSRACDRIYELELRLLRALRAARRLRRERDIARRQVAAVQASAQRAARDGQVGALAAELPAAWRAAS